MCTQQYCSLSLPMPPTFYISLISRENCLLLARLSKRHRERKWIQYSKLVTNVTNYSATHQLICYNPSTKAWPIIWMALSIGNKKNSINIYWKRIKVEGAHYKKKPHDNMDFPECRELWVYTGVLWCALHTACDIIDNRVGSWDWSWCCEIVNPKCKGGLVGMAGVLYEAPASHGNIGHGSFLALPMGLFCWDKMLIAYHTSTRWPISPQKKTTPRNITKMRIYRIYILIWHNTGQGTKNI